MQRGKQAESPVRGKFTLVWRGAPALEESRDQCGRSQSAGTRSAERCACRDQDRAQGPVRGVEDEGDE